MPPPDEALAPKELAESALLALILLALLKFPVALVNNTSRENADELAAVASRVGRGLRMPALARWSGRAPLAPALLLASICAGLLYGLLRPDLGIDRSSLAFILGVSLALLALNGLERGAEVVALRRWYRTKGAIRVFPGFVLVGVTCVVLSRVVGLQPGLLLGPLLTLRLPPDAGSTGKAGPVYGVAFALVAIGSVLAWTIRSPVLNALGNPGAFRTDVVGVALTTIFVSGLLVVALDMVPLSFCAGATVYAWSKPAWAAFSAVGAIGIVHVVVRPASGDLAFAIRAARLAALVAVYYVLAFAYWAWFRYRPGRLAPTATHQAPDGGGAPDSS